jgi:hypothetical protein
VIRRCLQSLKVPIDGLADNPSMHALTPSASMRWRAMPRIGDMVTSGAHRNGFAFFVANYELDAMTASMPSSVRDRLMMCNIGKPDTDEGEDLCEVELSSDELDMEEGSDAARELTKPVKRRAIRVPAEVDTHLTTSLTKWKVCRRSILF